MTWGESAYSIFGTNITIDVQIEDAKDFVDLSLTLPVNCEKVA
jgi:hypothetical protein